MNLNEKLILTTPVYFKDDTRNCGYCHGSKEDRDANYSLKSLSKDPANFKVGNRTIGFQVESMTIEQYDRLCNMGYRRSGNFIYKCDMLRNCCRLYTIRNRKELFKIDKEKKKSLNRFQKQMCDMETDEKFNEVNGKHSKPYNFISKIKQIEKNSSIFKTKFEPSEYSDEKYHLYCKFQEQIHDDHKHSKSSFKRFLCDSPFPEKVKIGSWKEWDQLKSWTDIKDSDNLKRLGPTHECYYYKDQLIAFAVTDFMPTGLSSVYFIWDPDYAKLSLGKVSALRELALSSKINNGYYYLGYYIDDCPKMNYKGKYGGEILDVSNRNYVPLDQLSKLIEKGKFFTLSHNQTIKTNSKEPLKEPFINNKLRYLRVPSEDCSDTMQNVAEYIYGIHGSAIVESNEAALFLKELGIPYQAEDINAVRTEDEAAPTKPELYKNKDGIDSLPNVLPGLIPLPELKQLVVTKEIDVLNNSMLIFNSTTGELRPLINFSTETPTIKRSICDTVRAIGLSNAVNSVLII